MASLLERMNVPASDATGVVRQKQNHREATAPYNRNTRPPKGDVDAQWTHDLYESGSLSARLSVKSTPPKINLTNITQKAIREATSYSTASQLSIKGAGSLAQGNVVEVSGLVAGTTAEDVVAIFKRCGDVANSSLVSGGDSVRIRVTFKSPSSATAAVLKFDNQPADGKILSVRVVGSTSAGTTLTGRLGGSDGLGLVRDEGSVDIFMDAVDTGSKLRSDALCDDPRAQVLLVPPGTSQHDYVPNTTASRGGGPKRGGRGRSGRGGKRGSQGPESRMDTD